MPAKGKTPGWFTCFEPPEECSDPALCTYSCTRWQDPFIDDDKRYAMSVQPGQSRSLPADRKEGLEMARRLIEDCQKHGRQPPKQLEELLAELEAVEQRRAIQAIQQSDKDALSE